MQKIQPAPSRITTAAYLCISFRVTNKWVQITFCSGYWWHLILEYSNYVQIAAFYLKFELVYRWLSARLQYLQCLMHWSFCSLALSHLYIIDCLWWLRSNWVVWSPWTYCKTSNISRTLVGNKIVDNSDVIGASPVGDAPTTSSFWA